MELPLGLASFQKQTRAEHAAVVGIAAVACAVAFALLLSIWGSLKGEEEIRRW